MLDVLLKRFLEGAELFFERLFEALGLLRGRLGFLVLLALACQRFRAFSEVLFRPRQGEPLTMQSEGRVLEFGGSPGDVVDLVLSGRQAALGGLVAQLPRHRVGLRDGLVDLPGGAAGLTAGVREQGRAPACPLRRLRDGPRVGKLAAGTAEVVEQRLRLAEFRLRLACPRLRLLDRRVVFLQAGAAAGGAVGRADVLGCRLGPGADVDAIAELRLGRDDRGGLLGGRTWLA